MITRGTINFPEDYKVDELLNEVEADKTETITKFEFMNHVYKYKSMMKPLFAYQVLYQ